MQKSPINLAQNAMIGAKGTLSGLWYPNRANFQGCLTRPLRPARGFYTHRLSGRHYIGATYRISEIVDPPRPGRDPNSEYCFSSTRSICRPACRCLFLRDRNTRTLTVEPCYRCDKWSPAAGGSLAWHGERTSFVASYARRISDGGGLSGAVLSNRADASVRWQLARTLTAGLGASYSTNSVLDSQLVVRRRRTHLVGSRVSPASTGRKSRRARWDTPACTRATAASPRSPTLLDRNYVWVSLSYQFERPLGR